METFFGHLGTGGESFEDGAGGAGQLFIVGLLVLGGARCMLLILLIDNENFVT